MVCWDIRELSCTDLVLRENEKEISYLLGILDSGGANWGLWPGNHSGTTGTTALWEGTYSELVTSFKVHGNQLSTTI